MNSSRCHYSANNGLIKMIVDLVKKVYLYSHFKHGR
nr:MAG TPA: hypothetical protein [Caudoviricetes sp.]